MTLVKYKHLPDGIIRSVRPFARALPAASVMDQFLVVLTFRIPWPAASGRCVKLKTHCHSFKWQNEEGWGGLRFDWGFRYPPLQGYFFYAKHQHPIRAGIVLSFPRVLNLAHLFILSFNASQTSFLGLPFFALS